jgi:hypothetical protein
MKDRYAMLITLFKDIDFIASSLDDLIEAGLSADQKLLIDLPKCKRLIKQLQYEIGNF